MTAVHPRRSARRRGSDDQADEFVTDAILDAISRREIVSDTGDPVIRMLAALVADVSCAQGSCDATCGRQ
ncbi:hypothetical protein [Sinosporangium siamense]|uniref:Uncharacterized protein n=1 Tax=Sinosporangium siamense TaxID=1367973 RepID=A0A919RCC4_9ACTN|nr:hypothetical protein [Sinosporangium siamense]GII90837.1 hypothetical protein Ssi02_10680 [Sinosporangium siamense]